MLSFSVYLSPSDGPAVILISLDGFRWDYLLRNLTPNMQQLIDTGVSAPCTRHRHDGH